MNYEYYLIIKADEETIDKIMKAATLKKLSSLLKKMDKIRLADNEELKIRNEQKAENA